MSRALIAGKSGWGKSYFSQAWFESNMREYDIAVVADYKDEYRGLVTYHNSINWLPSGKRELGFSAGDWETALRRNKQVVVSRTGLTQEEWQKLIGTISKAVRDSTMSALMLLDEAHFLAPQRTAYPEAIKGLATTGRGENVSTMWVTQRLSEMDETPIAQCDVRILGGFSSDADLKKIDGVTDYPSEVHNPNLTDIPTLPKSLGPQRPVEKRTQNGSIVGSEWIYSDDSGTLERLDSADITLKSEHTGAEGKTLSKP